jgi:hypothetical protein
LRPSGARAFGRTAQKLKNRPIPKKEAPTPGRGAKANYPAGYSLHTPDPGTLLGVSSFEPSDSADQMQPGKEVASCFFVACRDTSIMLDGIEEPLDEIALGVECEVAGSFDPAV